MMVAESHQAGEISPSDRSSMEECSCDCARTVKFCGLGLLEVGRFMWEEARGEGEAQDRTWVASTPSIEGLWSVMGTGRAEAGVATEDSVKPDNSEVFPILPTSPE